ncbi:MAG: twin-arginine translocase TatA/TatE family subunit [Coriobacteriales bacterium]|nr:twin-arginine translocase TatA/TatE family subunit [Coriobacteriales bacterium]
MRIFGMGMPEMIIILLVILVIFGPKNLPKLGSALGKAVKGVREGVDSVNSELEAAKGSAEKAAKGSKEEDPITATAVVEEVPAQEAAQTAAAGFCSQCGTALEADAKFCKSCGAASS